MNELGVHTVPDDDSVLNRETVCRKASYVPVSYLHRVSQCACH